MDDIDVIGALFILVLTAAGIMFYSWLIWMLIQCGVRLIPYTYSYIFDYVNRKAIRVCKRCHDEHVRRKSKNARTHGNE